MAISGSGIDKRPAGADSRPRSGRPSGWDGYGHSKQARHRATCGRTVRRKERSYMNKENTIYLAYGSNLNLKQMAQRCPTAKVLGGAKLNGYRLWFRGSRGSAVATVEKEKGSSVPVLLWEIQPQDEAALDRYEGYPWLYRKETVKVRFKGKWVEAMVYIMNEGRPLGAPGRYYYEVIREGYIDAGFYIPILDEAVRKSARTAVRIKKEVER